MVLMHHKIGYIRDEKQNWCTSTLKHTGRDSVHTAMSELVGLPLAMYVKSHLNSGPVEAGVHIPLSPAIYEPILTELAESGIHFNESWSEQD